MAHKESPLSAAIKGTAAGLLGTVVMTAGLKYGPEALQRLGVDAPQPPAGADKAEPPEQLAGKLARGVFDTRLNKQGKEVGGQVLHWGYGAGWGALYGILQSTFRLPFALHGTLLGALVAVVASTLIPAMGVAPPANKVPTNQKLVQASVVMLYGWTTALAYHFLSRE